MHSLGRFKDLYPIKDSQKADYEQYLNLMHDVSYMKPGFMGYRLIGDLRKI